MTSVLRPSRAWMTNNKVSKTAIVATTKERTPPTPHTQKTEYKMFPKGGMRTKKPHIHLLQGNTFDVKLYY